MTETEAPTSTETPEAAEPSNTTARHRILALYKFVKIPQEDLASLRVEVETNLRSTNARGTILLAPEGINGTISYPLADDKDNDTDPVLNFLQSHKYFNGLRIRISQSHSGHVFHRLKIKVKKEIVTLGCDRDTGASERIEGGCCRAVDPTVSVGTYVKPGKDWDALLMDPDVVVIDTRNRYETEIGTFVNAVDPDTFSFTEFPSWMQKFASGIKDERDSKTVLKEPTKLAVGNDDGAAYAEGKPKQLNRKPKAVAMFCTGGIRCEKSTSFVLSRKFFPEDIPVYHLEGGILGYLDTVPESESMWRGECFVFDQRVSVKHGLVPSDTYSSCHGCRRAVSAADRAGPDYVRGVCCKHCRGELTDKQLERFREREKQMNMVERGLVDKHIHDPNENTAAEGN